jgi:hypothetical protein
MGLGNGNPKSGDKGSNFNYELKVLQGLEAIANALDGGGGSGDPALNPGPAFSSAVFDASDIIGFNDTNISMNAAWGTYQKVGNIVSTDININVGSMTAPTGTISVILPVTVVGDISLDTRFVTGTMNVSDKIAGLLINYDITNGSDPSAIKFNYKIDPLETGSTVIRLNITYVYNTNIIVLGIDNAPFIL